MGDDNRQKHQQLTANPPAPPLQRQPGYEQGPLGYEQGPSGYGYQQAPPEQKPRKRRRLFLWFFLAVQVIFLIWIIAGTQSAHCDAHGSATANGACSAGAAIGAGLIIALWVAADVILGLIYIVYRLSTRNR